MNCETKNKKLANEPRAMDSGTQDIDKLLERIRNLQKFLPEPSPSSPSRSAGTLPRTNFFNFSPPEKESAAALRKTPSKHQSEPLFSETSTGHHRRLHPNIHEKSGEKARSREIFHPEYQMNASLGNPASGQHLDDHVYKSSTAIEECLSLLQQVTFVRVAVDRLVWERTPPVILKDFGKSRSPRERGQLVLEYQFPNGNSTFQTLKKRIRAVSRTVLPGVVHFNHRRVALVKITSSLVQSWTNSSLWFRILYQWHENKGKMSVVQIGRCHICLSDVLEIPFFVEKTLDLDCFSSGGNAKGKLQVSVQLGSRLPSFTERVEEIRQEIATSGKISAFQRKETFSKTPAKSPFRYIDQSRVLRGRSNSGQSGDEGLSANQQSPKQISQSEQAVHGISMGLMEPVTLASREQYAQYAEGERDSPQLSDAGHQKLRSDKWAEPRSRIEPIRIRDERFLVDRVGKPTRLEHPPLAHSTRRFSTGLVLSSTSPQISPCSFDLIDQGVQSKDWKSAGVQTSESVAGAAVKKVNVGMDTVDREIQADVEDEECTVGVTAPRSLTGVQHQKKVGAAAGVITVADRLRVAGARRSSGSANGHWLKMTVHSAHNLPLMKGPNGHGAVKPNVFVTYQAGGELKRSEVVEHSTDPVWNWSSLFQAPRERRNIVLKFWHKCPERGDRVLGFVCLDLAGLGSKEGTVTGSYDLVDLSQCSTGSVKMTIVSRKSLNLPATLPSEEFCSSFRNFGKETDEVLSEMLEESVEMEAAAGRLQTEFLEPEKSIGDVGSHASVEAGTAAKLRNAFDEKAVNTSMRSWAGESRKRSGMEEYLEMASKSFLAEKLRTNMNELDALLGNLHIDMSNKGQSGHSARGTTAGNGSEAHLHTLDLEGERF